MALHAPRDGACLDSSESSGLEASGAYRALDTVPHPQGCPRELHAIYDHSVFFATGWGVFDAATLEHPPPSSTRTAVGTRYASAISSSNPAGCSGVQCGGCLKALSTGEKGGGAGTQKFVYQNGPRRFSQRKFSSLHTMVPLVGGEGAWEEPLPLPLWLLVILKTPWQGHSSQQDDARAISMVAQGFQGGIPSCPRPCLLGRGVLKVRDLFLFFLLRTPLKDRP